MNLDAAIEQLRREIERLKAALAVLENLQRKRRMESLQQTAKRTAAKTKPKRLAGASRP